MDRLDFKAINAAAWDHIESFARGIDPLAKHEGSEWTINAFWRGEQGRNSLKANTEKRIIKDFATNQTYDPIKLMAAHLGTGNFQAAKELQERFGPSRPTAPIARRALLEANGGTPVAPVPPDTPDPDWHALGNPTRWAYRDAQGRLLRYHLRFDLPGKRKDYRPLTWCKFKDGSGRWTKRGLPDPQPLYGLHLLSKSPTATVVVVEGEKAADWAQSLFPGFIFVSTANGAGKGAATDLEPLRSRDVVLWPDNDTPGLGHVQGLAKILREKGIKVRVVQLPPNLPVKWDLADPWPVGWTPATVQHLIESAQSPEAEAPPPAASSPTRSTFLGEFARTEFGLADRFRRRFGEECLWDVARKDWLIFDGTRWTESAGRVELKAQQVIRDLGTELADVAEDHRTAFIKFMLDSQRASKQSALLTIARAALSCGAGEMDQDRELFNCVNGTLDLRTGLLRPHAPEDRITKLAGAPFDPQARAPRFLRFVEEITSEPRGDGDFKPRPDLAEALQRFAGYVLTGSLREQCLMFLIGGGSNGKGVFIEVLRLLLADYAKVVPASLLIKKDQDPHPTDVATLAGARLAIIQEVNKGCAWDEAKLKALTGGDALTARFTYRDFFEFEPQHKFLVSANHRPTVQDATHSFWRRMRIIPFDRRFDGDQKDPDLLEKLKGELPGILAWAVQGCMAWRREGLLETARATEAVRSYRDDSSSFNSFMEANFQPCSNGQIRAMEFRSIYATWAEETGESNLNQKAMWQALQEYAVTAGIRVSKGTNNGTVYYGITHTPIQSRKARKGTEGCSVSSPIQCLEGDLPGSLP